MNPNTTERNYENENHSIEESKIPMNSSEWTTPLQLSTSEIIRLNEQMPKKLFDQRSKNFKSYLIDLDDKEKIKSKRQDYKPKIIMFKKRKSNWHL